MAEAEGKKKFKLKMDAKMLGYAAGAAIGGFAIYQIFLKKKNPGYMASSSQYGQFGTTGQGLASLCADPIYAAQHATDCLPYIPGTPLGHTLIDAGKAAYQGLSGGGGGSGGSKPNPYPLAGVDLTSWAQSRQAALEKTKSDLQAAGVHPDTANMIVTTQSSIDQALAGALAATGAKVSGIERNLDGSPTYQGLPRNKLAYRRTA